MTVYFDKNKSDINFENPLFETKERPRGKLAGTVPKPSVISGMLAIVCAVALLIIGAVGAVGLVKGSIIGWSILGTSAALTLFSAGIASPATLVTLILAILGLTGVLPFHSVGLGVAITMGIVIVSSVCYVSEKD